jgi:HrpA-like RNA helicase
LQAKLVSEKISLTEFLSRAINPPVQQAVDAAVKLLQDIGALEEDESMTTLGSHLAALPLPPQLGKLLLYGLLFDCVDPVLTIACAMSYRCPSLVSCDAFNGPCPPCVQPLELCLPLMGSPAVAPFPINGYTNFSMSATSPRTQQDISSRSTGAVLHMSPFLFS